MHTTLALRTVARVRGFNLGIENDCDGDGAAAGRAGGQAGDCGEEALSKKIAMGTRRHRRPSVSGAAGNGGKTVRARGVEAQNGRTGAPES